MAIRSQNPGISSSLNRFSSATLSSDVAVERNHDIFVNWTYKEQAILQEGLSKYASESNIVRYAKIAQQLQRKTIRDVALRVKWMKLYGICLVKPSCCIIKYEEKKSPMQCSYWFQFLLICLNYLSLFLINIWDNYYKLISY